jgi:signal transduction histidine kinase
MHKHRPFQPRRPHWWPENEAWPPVPTHGRLIRHRFFRRMGCLFFISMILVITTIFVALGFLADRAGMVHFPGWSLGWMIPFGILFFLLGAGSLAWIGRNLRHFILPVGNMIEAIEQVAGGDYSVRLDEWGPSDFHSLARAFNAMVTRLETNDAQRRNLLADVTHELRTPLTVIQGNLEAMIDGVYPADEPHLKSLLEESQMLSRLIEDLRILSLSESGTLQLRKEPTNLYFLVNETLSVFKAQADAKNIKFDVASSPDIPFLDIDPERIRQVISNLIANAMRYTPDGGMVGVRLEIIPDGNQGQVLVTVTDNGPGIAPDDLPHIFDRFYKTRDSGGMGLGLSIAKNLVEAHGGVIRAESEPGKGSIIRFSLPVSVVPSI